MIVKPKYTPADPTSVCKTCVHHDPNLHVCCANDVVVSDDVAKTKCCGDWEPKHICITCGYFDPDTNQCWFEEHDMSEEESLTRTCKSWEPRKDHDKLLQVVGKSCDNCGKCHPVIAMCTEHPDRNIWPPKENVCDEWVEMPAKLQPDGSLKMKAKETIGAFVVNPDGVTKLTFGGTSLKELEEKQKGLEKTLHIESDMPEIPKDTRKALSEFMSNDGSIVRARMLESLDIVFGLAIQQAPTLRERWIRLREQCIGALQMRWKQEDEKKESKP